MNEHLSKVLHDRTISLADEESVRDVLARSVFGLWQIVNDLTRIRPTKRDRFQVTIFGSARTLPGTDSYEEAKRVALREPHAGVALLARLDQGDDCFVGRGLAESASRRLPHTEERVVVERVFKQFNGFLRLSFS